MPAHSDPDVLLLYATCHCDLGDESARQLSSHWRLLPITALPLDAASRDGILGESRQATSIRGFLPYKRSTAIDVRVEYTVMFSPFHRLLDSSL